MNPKTNYDKHAEHQDRTSLGKLRSKYWTTKQLVMKKLGREEDEFIVASDADVDAKLELLISIKDSCQDLLRIMVHYQNNVLYLSHEEIEFARFLKDYAQNDLTRAGKMMASVSKVLAHTAQQRLDLRQPLSRLSNEIETFRHRAVTDTLSTVKRMETARTEYRGSILWLKDASVQLDPEKQLEKFRRVQSQVKSTKAEYDRLKSDVIQKVDLLTASRCNMFSHVLDPYQKSLVQFWEKTSKTMSTVALSFQGYQYYEFHILKDLTEPSRLLAEGNPTTPKTDQTATETNASSKESEPVLALIDISDSQFDEQLLELEKLTNLDQVTSPAKNADEPLLQLSKTTGEDDQLLADLLSTTDLLMNEMKSQLGPISTASQQAAAMPSKTNQFLPSSLLNDLLSSNNKPPTAPGKSSNSNWLNLFAELDPLQNPDAIGKSLADEIDRNC